MKRGYRWPLAVLVTAICLAAAIYLMEPAETARILTTTDPRLIAAVVALSLLMALLRAARLAALVRAPRFWPVARASLAHNAANAILPARLGEAALPIALARYAGLDMAHGIGLLLMVRLNDLAMLCALGLGLVAALDVWPLTFAERAAFAVAGLTLAIGAGALPRVVGAMAQRDHGWAGRFAERLIAAAEALGRGSAATLTLTTLAIWMVLMVASQLSTMAVGLDADPALAALACVAASLAFALPVNGIASVGPFEAAFTAVLVGGGVPAEQALAAAVLLHACALAAAGISGAAAFLSPGQESEAPPCR